MSSKQATNVVYSAELDHPVTDIRYVSGVSWPRSGHHAVANVLSAYFGPKFMYCEHYLPTDCCKSQPCTRNGIHLSKNHDFEFDSIASDNVPYLIQYRSFITSVVSNFEVAVYNNSTADNADSFREFSIYYANRYVRFVQKWIFDIRQPKERLVVKYDTLMEDPLPTMTHIVKFFAPGNDVDRGRLAECIETAPIEIIGLGTLSNVEGHGLRPNRDIRSFRYYDDDFFNALNMFTWFPEP